MGNLARDVLCRMPSTRLYFCLLIVRYMLSDKIKGKSALNARTFLHVRDKVHVYVIGTGCLCIKPFIGEIFTYNKHSDPIYMDFLCHIHKTDMPRARIRSYNYREKTPI